LLRVRPVERLAKFAAVDFGVRSDQRFDFFRIVVPALQVAGAEFALFIFFIARALLVLANLDLDFFFGQRRGCRLGGNSSGCGGGGRCGSGAVRHAFDFSSSIRDDSAARRPTDRSAHCHSSAI
jgi:hypothetical protein